MNDAMEPPALPPEREPLAAPASPPPAKRILFHLAPLAVFLALLGGIELATRLVLPEIDSLDVFVSSPLQHHNLKDGRNVRIFTGDPLLFWRLKPGLDNVIWDYTLVSTNERGWRHAVPIGRKPRGGFRVVCLGDSVTFGYRVPTVWAEQPDDYSREAIPYPALLERRLRAINPRHAIDVVALAVPGYSSHQGVALLHREIAGLDPDVVTICFGWNDVSLRERADRELMPMNAWAALRRGAIARSQALLHASAWLQGQKPFARSPSRAPARTPRVARDDYVANILAAASIAERQGAAVAVIAPVYRDTTTNPSEARLMRAYRDALRSATSGAGVPYLEIPELTEQAAASNLRLFGELIHPNHIGHRLMTTRILNFLAAQGMLKKISAEAAEQEAP